MTVLPMSAVTHDTSWGRRNSHTSYVGEVVEPYVVVFRFAKFYKDQWAFLTMLRNKPMVLTTAHGQSTAQMQESLPAGLFCTAGVHLHPNAVPGSMVLHPVRGKIPRKQASEWSPLPCLRKDAQAIRTLSNPYHRMAAWQLANTWEHIIDGRAW